MKRMTPKQFWQQGYLQEVNRQFLHPLGLALEIKISEDGETVKLGKIWDSQDSPEGIIFEPGLLSEEKANRVQAVWNEKSRERMNKYGWVVQPIE